MAVLMHAVCHPCVFTWGDKWSPPHPDGYPKMSADFPGEAKGFVEKVYGEPTQALFLQGCAGDIRPNLPGLPYRCGDEADIRWIGRDLGCAVVRAADRAVDPRGAGQASRRSIRSSARATVVDLPRQGGKPVRCELQAMKVGPYLFLTMPGEPFVEYGFRLEKAIADRAVPIVVGYANGEHRLHLHGPGLQGGGLRAEQSRSGAGGRGDLIAESLEKLADRVIGDVFESFAPRLPVDRKNYTPSIPIETDKQ